MDRDRRIKSAWDVFATSASAATPFSRAATTTATAGDERSRGQIISSSSCSTTAASADVLAGSDSAISAGSSDEEREICRIFDYLDEHDEPDNTGSHHSTQHHHHRHQHHHPTRFHHQEVLGGGGGAPASRRTRHQTVTTCGRAAGKSVRDKPAELKHIEQHLSMKKTLRKKMMRDLRQAFVDDPSEFCGDQSRLSGEQRHLIDINKLHIAGDRTRASERGGGIGGEHNFLNMLRQNDTSPDSGHDSPVLETTPYTSVRHKQQPSQPQASPPAVKEKISFWKRLTGATGHGAGKKSK